MCEALRPVQLCGKVEGQFRLSDGLDLLFELVAPDEEERRHDSDGRHDHADDERAVETGHQRIRVARPAGQGVFCPRGRDR